MFILVSGQTNKCSSEIFHSAIPQWPLKSSTRTSMSIKATSLCSLLGHSYYLKRVNTPCLGVKSCFSVGFCPSVAVRRRFWTDGGSPGQCLLFMYTYIKGRLLCINRHRLAPRRRRRGAEQTLSEAVVWSLIGQSYSRLFRVCEDHTYWLSFPFLLAPTCPSDNRTHTAH